MTRRSNFNRKGVLGIRDFTEIHCGIRDKAKFLDWIRYLAATRGAGFAKIFAQDEVLGKKTVLIKITEVAHAGLS